MQQYYDIKSKYPGILLFFRLGDFYEMFGPDAKEGSRLMGLTLTARGGEDMCGVPYHSAGGYIAKLLKHGRKVAICEQTSNVADPKTKLFERAVTRVITPGTILEDDMLDAKNSNYLVSIEITAKGWGLACLEASTGHFWLTQNDDDADLIALSSVLGGINPPEILAPREAQAKLKAKLMMPAEITLSAPPATGGDDMPATWPGALRAYPGALKAAIACHKYVSYVNKGFKEYFAPYYKEITDFMQLDQNAVNTLELAQSHFGGRKNTLWGLLDYAQTAMGSRLLKDWVLRPLLDKEEIISRQNAVGGLLAQEHAKDRLAFILKEISDIERIMTRVANSSAGPRDLAGLRKSLLLIDKFEVWFKSCGALLPGFAAFFETNLNVLKEVSQKLFDAVADAPPIRLSDGGIIKQGYSPELDELRGLKNNASAKLEEIAAREKERTGISTLRVGFNSVFGYYIEVSKSQVSKVPYDYTRKQTLTNAERFITEELKELEKKILSAQDSSLKIELALFEEIKKYLYERLGVLKQFAAHIARADSLYALAEAAANGGYVRPQIADKTAALHIEQGRHPIVEQNIPAGSFVPNDIYIGADGPQIMIITGPNMGGKSVYLKQTALITILAQIGSFVPARSAQIPLTDKILTRIGAQDALSMGQSTFMVEMTETAQILAAATDATLVLLDEVGRGTSTFDGISIAWAIAEHLHKPHGRGPKVLFATHYFELTELEEKYAKIRNYHVEASEYKTEEGELKLNFLFEIKQGAADKSYGIHVADIAGLPKSCVLRARKLLKDLGERQSTGINKKEARGTDLFSSPIVEEIKLTELDKLTPLAALQLIAAWKKRLE
jgi:DNA mismatch repair protein MutS